MIAKNCYLAGHLGGEHSLEKVALPNEEHLPKAASFRITPLVNKPTSLVNKPDSTSRLLTRPETRCVCAHTAQQEE